jgi:alcohol dehydrogenase class IV
MPAFEFFGVGRIVFGRGKFAEIGEIAAAFGRHALIVYNGDDLGRGGALDRLTDLLATQSILFTTYRQNGEPIVADIDAAVQTARHANCDCVIALGGGSAIDAGKAIAAILTNGGEALDYMEVVGRGQKITKAAAPWIAIPTTAGTGAEATRNAVIGFPEKQFKASIRSELLLPRVALIDAELAVKVPAEVTASSGMDALCQLIESYTSINANPVTDALALQGLSAANRSLRRAYVDGRDVEAREGMAMAALLSGMTLTSAGLGAVHGFAAPMGANYPIPHGTVCAVLLPHVIAANVAALRSQDELHPALARYAAIGRTFPGSESLEDAAAIDRVVFETASLARDLHIPSLSHFGFTRDAIPGMVALARKASSMRYNPVTLSDDALAVILERAL